jgi:hypothetical protein
VGSYGEQENTWRCRPRSKVSTIGSRACFSNDVWKTTSPVSLVEVTDCSGHEKT